MDSSICVSLLLLCTTFETLSITLGSDFVIAFDVLPFFLVYIDILDVVCGIVKSIANYELLSVSSYCAIDSYRKADAPKYNHDGIDRVHFLKKDGNL